MKQLIEWKTKLGSWDLVYRITAWGRPGHCMLPWPYVQDQKLFLLAAPHRHCEILIPLCLLYRPANNIQWHSWAWEKKFRYACTASPAYSCWHLQGEKSDWSQTWVVLCKCQDPQMAVWNTPIQLSFKSAVVNSTPWMDNMSCFLWPCFQGQGGE